MFLPEVNITQFSHPLFEARILTDFDSPRNPELCINQYVIDITERIKTEVEHPRRSQDQQRLKTHLLIQVTTFNRGKKFLSNLFTPCRLLQAIYQKIGIHRR